MGGHRALLHRLRQVVATGPGWEEHHHLRIVDASDEDWWAKHTNQGSYARWAEDAARRCGWPDAELATAVGVAYNRESFRGQTIEFRCRTDMHTVACVCQDRLINVACFEWNGT